MSKENGRFLYLGSLGSLLKLKTRRLNIERAHTQ
ncbi:resolvase, partial [Salmonella enterica subsp. enterica]|nr:resolvase [Salmonella enterica subsp. enterica]